MIRNRDLILGLATLAMAAPLAAQQPSSSAEHIGRVVAVVGDSAVFNFDIQEALFARAAQQRVQVPAAGTPERQSWEREVLEERVNELLLLQAALRDTTIVINENQLSAAVQQDIEQRQRQVGGPVEFEQALHASGLTLAEYRQLLMQQQRNAALVQQYIQRQRQRRKAPPVSEQEMRTLFENMRGQFSDRPPSISFQMVRVLVEPSEAAAAVALTRADSVLQRIAARDDFAQIARRISDDIGSREQGGDLGWFRRGTMVPEFENVAFSMRPGAVSMPVRTKYGYHIIKVERSRQGEIQARHILLRPEVTDADALRARARADTVAERLRAGDDATELARRFGDRNAPVRFNDVDATYIQQVYGLDVSQEPVGATVGPIPHGGDDIAEEFIVLRITDRQASRPWSIDDPAVRERLAENVQMQKLFEEVVADLRRSTYVEIRS